MAVAASTALWARLARPVKRAAVAPPPRATLPPETEGLDGGGEGLGVPWGRWAFLGGGSGRAPLAAVLIAAAAPAAAAAGFPDAAGGRLGPLSYPEGGLGLYLAAAEDEVAPGFGLYLAAAEEGVGFREACGTWYGSSKE